MSSSAASGAGVYYVDLTAAAIEQCEKWSHEFPDLAGTYLTPLAHACQHKLWHQLTLLVHALVHDASAANRIDSNGVQLYWGVYHDVILAVESKLNSLSLAAIAAQVSASLVAASSASASATDTTPDWTAAKALLENLLDKLQQQQQKQQQELLQRQQNEVPRTFNKASKLGGDPHEKAVLVYVQSKLAMLQLREQQYVQQQPQPQPTPALTKADLRDVAQTVKGTADQLDKLGDAALLDPRVYAAHHELAWQYYKAVGPPEDFCRSALAFVQFESPPADLASSSSEKSAYWIELGVDLCWAALTGEGIYADLHHVAAIAHQLILQSHLQQPLVRLVEAVANGSVAEGRALFQTIAATATSGDQRISAAVLQQWQPIVWEKLSLLALVQLAFDKPSHERALTFAEIAQRLDIAPDNVERTVMRACSVGLLKATLDQVDETVVVHHAVPRRLDHPDALRALASRYGAWAQQVQTMHRSMTQAWTDNNAPPGGGAKGATATAGA